MLNLAVLFFVLAIFAGMLGFGVITSAAAAIAQLLFLLFVVLFVASLIMGRRGLSR